MRQLQNTKPQSVPADGALVLSCNPAETADACNAALNIIKDAFGDNVPEEVRKAFRTLTDGVGTLAEAACLLAEALKETREEAKVARHRMFGRRNEKKQEKTAEKKERKPRKPRGSSSITRDRSALETQTQRYELSEDQKICPHCGRPLTFLGHEERWRYGIRPMRILVFRDEIESWKCPHCAMHGDKEYVVRAKAPAPVLPGSMADASALVEVIFSKYGLGLPLYRQEQIWRAQGCSVSRQTMSNWAVKTSELLYPLYERLLWHIGQADSLHGDETSLRVLRKTGPNARSKSTEWLVMTGKHEPRQAVAFVYKDSRAHEHAADLFSDFIGTLHADGYEAYHHLKDVSLVCGCMTHARRRFIYAWRVLDPEDQENPDIPEVQALAFFERLYAIEKEAANLTAKQRKAFRQKHARPVLDHFKKWLEAHEENATGEFGKAVRYTLGQWEYLTNYLDDGDAEIDNNRAERAIRPFAVGRKNWLFAGSEKGAQALSVYHSILGSAKLNGLQPRQYLAWLLEQIVLIDLNDIDQLDRLMPWNAPSELRICSPADTDAANAPAA